MRLSHRPPKPITSSGASSIPVGIMTQPARGINGKDRSRPTPRPAREASPISGVVNPRNTTGSLFRRSGKKRMVCMGPPQRIMSADLPNSQRTATSNTTPTTMMEPNFVQVDFSFRTSVKVCTAAIATLINAMAATTSPPITTPSCR
uniref:Uncharacterized protein n=1 Tax=Edwardsiella ictaluri TaxID=67780 RepID=Q6GUD7_EDWIC|nr:hypothetical protein [Edwardsiella ictaluri]